MNLEYFVLIKNNLKSFSSKIIKTLHEIVFGEIGDRNNRKRLRKFSGFNFTCEDKKIKIDSVYKHFALNDLINACNVLCLCCDGTKQELSNILIDNLNDLNVLQTNIVTNEDDSDEDISENESLLSEKNLNDEQQIGNKTSVKLPVTEISKLAINFNDVENSIKPFTGNDYQSIQKWVSEFEEISDLFNLSDLHKLIFAKRSLADKAKLFIQGETFVNSWSKLKTLLLEEFGEQFNSADLHTMLSKRHIKEGESVEEYFLVMKEMAIKGSIEDAALISYVINGIRDSTNNKTILYGSKTLKEFKANLKIYSRMRSDNEASKSKAKLETMTHKPKQQIIPKTYTDSRCFNCGNKGHKSKDCANREKGTKCFQCNKFGHKASECTNRPETKSSHVTVENTNSLHHMLKNVVISNLNLTALVDTGSQMTMINEDIYNKIGRPNLQFTNIKLSGLGNCIIKPKGLLKTSVIIDGAAFDSNVCVVTNSALRFDCIIGIDIINQSEMVINKNGITFKNNDDDFLVNLTHAVEFQNEYLELSHLDSSARSEVKCMIHQFHPIRTKSVDVKMKIILSDEIPVSCSPRRFPLSERIKIKKQIEEWLQDGIIRRSSSDFASNIVLAKKKDGSSRLCIDYRRLNKKIIRDRFPLPLIDDVLDKLGSAKVYSTLDLKNGFFHVDVCEESRKYTSFVTEEGQFEFLKVPFGLVNSPSVFQRYIYNVFRDLLNENIVIIYMDDIIIPSEDEKEGLTKLKRVLNTASEYGLELNIKKCQFLRHEIEFLGHRIKSGKIYPSTSKTKAVLNFPEPKSTKEVQSYLGLTGYFRKFIPNYSTIAKPLSDLLKKDCKFHFDTEQRNSYNQLKIYLCEEPVLCIYDPKSETEIHTDASIDGYGAVLVQKSTADNEFHPILYMSRKTSDTERRYSSYELEVLAVIEALKKFRVYVLGIPFKIVTDCNAFRLTMDKKDVCTKIARWALMLQDYEYTIEHRSGTKMRHVDALSRIPICMFVEDKVSLALKRAQETDDTIKTTKELMKTSNNKNYIERNGILYKWVDEKEVTVVPESMQTEIIRDAHEKGHKGEPNFVPKLKQKTLKNKSSKFKKKAKRYNLRRRQPRPYNIGDLVAIKRTQLGPHLKLKPKYFGPYKITKVKGGNTYDVVKEGRHEGPTHTTTCAEYMKPWREL